MKRILLSKIYEKDKLRFGDSYKSLPSEEDQVEAIVQAYEANSQADKILLDLIEQAYISLREQTGILPGKDIDISDEIVVSSTVKELMEKIAKFPWDTEIQ